MATRRNREGEATARLIESVQKPYRSSFCNQGKSFFSFHFEDLWLWITNMEMPIISVIKLVILRWSDGIVKMLVRMNKLFWIPFEILIFTFELFLSVSTKGCHDHAVC